MTDDRIRSVRIFSDHNASDVDECHAAFKAQIDEAFKKAATLGARIDYLKVSGGGPSDSYDYGITTLAFFKYPDEPY